MPLAASVMNSQARVPVFVSTAYNRPGIEAIPGWLRSAT
jgi:hypothetical protein